MSIRTRCDQKQCEKFPPKKSVDATPMRHKMMSMQADADKSETGRCNRCKSRCRPIHNVMQHVIHKPIRTDTTRYTYDTIGSSHHTPKPMHAAMQLVHAAMQTMRAAMQTMRAALRANDGQDHLSTLCVHNRTHQIFSGDSGSSRTRPGNLKKNFADGWVSSLSGAWRTTHGAWRVAHGARRVQMQMCVVWSAGANVCGLESAGAT